MIDLHDSVDNRHDLLPRGYAILPKPPPFAAAYWDTKKITLVPGTLAGFVDDLAELRAGTRGVQPIGIGEQPLLPPFLRAVNPASGTAYDLAATFDFPDFDDGAPEAHTFFHGGPATWATLRARVDAYRDVTDTILEWLIIPPSEEPVGTRRSATQVALLQGHAGAGKSTLARRLAWALVHDWSRPALWVKQPGRLQFDALEAAGAFADGRLYVFVDDAADAGQSIAHVIERSRRRGLRITFVVVERANEWEAATRDHPTEPDRSFLLSSLSDGEALGLARRLEQAGELGTLLPMPEEERVRILIERAGRDMVVGLREATEDKRFDQILEDEYKSLPGEAARRAYATVCTLFQFGVATRAGILSRITGVPFVAFGDEILGPAAGVILELQEQPWEQPRYVARHRVIADVVFRRAYPSSSQRALQVQALLQNLDPGYRDDARAFGKLINARWLRDHGIEDDDQRGIYQLARGLRPEDPFVIQQEGLSWRHRDRVLAARLLNEAAASAPNNDAIKHSQAVLTLDDAKEARGEERARLLTAAEAAFRTLIRQEPQNTAPYVSLAEIDLVRAADAQTPGDRLAMLASASRTVSEAFRRSSPTSYLLEMAGKIEVASGNLDRAADDYRAAALAAVGDPHVWGSYARFLLAAEGPEAAAAALNQALDVNPIDPQLNHEFALVLERVTPINDLAIRKAYGIAIAEPVRGHLPELDFAIYLHQHGAPDEAEAHFQSLRAADLPARIKSQPRRWLTDEDGSRLTLRADIADVRHSRSYVRVPGIESTVFMHTTDIPSEARRPNATITVQVHYNCFGPRAIPVLTEDEVA